SVFRRIEESDAVVLGSPIYLGTVTGEMRSFLERWIFPYLTYTDPPQTLFPRRIRTAFIYTMNMGEEELKARGMFETYAAHYALNEGYLARIFGAAEHLLCTDTLQFDDYSRVVADRWDAEAKARRREEVFPADCERAFRLGRTLLDQA
ncbi:MAG: flavodoxin family protein, partial [bacterium]